MHRHLSIGLIAASAVIGSASAAIAHQAQGDHPPTRAHAASVPAPSASPSTSSRSSGASRVLGVENLLRSSDLTTVGFEPDASSMTGGGDAQYAISPCLHSSLGGLTGANVFSGSWYDDPTNAVSESITEVDTVVQAQKFASTIRGWHRGRCAERFTVGSDERQALPAGWIHTFTLTDASGGKSFAAVVRQGERIAVLDIDASGLGVDRAAEVFTAAAERLEQGAPRT